MGGLATGIWRGTVTNNADPQGRSRIKARVPALLGPTAETTWAEAVAPQYWVREDTEPGGDPAHVHENEFLAELDIPAVGQGVWLSFESGDIDKPLWLGVVR